MKGLSVILALVLVFSVLVVQAPAAKADNFNYWARSYGGSGTDVINDVKVLSDGSIIAVGYTTSSGAGGKDVLVMKLSPEGSLAWAKTYGGTKDDVANAVALASNGDVIVAGLTYSFGAGDWDFWVLRLDENGNVKWQKTYGGESWDKANAVAVADNGDVIVAGDTWSFGAGNRDFWVLRLPPDGNLLGFSKDSNAKITLPSPDVWDSKAAVKDSSVTPRDSHAYPNPAELTVKTQYGPASLTINSNPSGADVYINGDYKGETPLIVQVSPGTHQVKLTKQDYQDYTATITLNPAESKTLNVELTPAFGYLTVKSNPSGAKVYVDGSYIGNTPLENYKLSTGQHSLKVTKQGYQDYTTTVTINPGKTTVVNAQLIPQPASLTIDSNPSGADVYIDGDYKGTTPLTLNLTPRTHQIKLTRQDYKNYTTTITINPGESKSISVTLTPALGHLTINSNPLGAKVYINGTYKGTTPLTLNLTPRTHQVKIVKITRITQPQ